MEITGRDCTCVPVPDEDGQIRGKEKRKGEHRSCRQYVIWEHVLMAPLAQRLHQE